jgi:4-amino-4-deoxy-L-arabinose transferase-like glycosyltransferase
MMSTLVPLRRARLRLAANGRLLPPFALLAALCLLFFFQLGARDLVSSHEARAAQNAQRMLDTGEWGLPTLFDGQRDLQKPPGFYWLVAAAGRLAGGHVSPWAARLPAALGAVAAVLLVYAFLRREGYSTGAVVGAAALATANHFVAIGRTARIDVPLTCAVAAALLAFYRGCHFLPFPLAGEGSGASPPGEGAHQQRGSAEQSSDSSPTPHPASKTRPPSPARGEGEDTAAAPGGNTDFAKSGLGWFLLAALAAGVAVLLKGPVGLALVGTAAVAFLLVERLAAPPERRPKLPLSAAVLGVAVVAVVAVPWFVWANRATGGEFVRVFFWHHNVARFTGESESLASHPWWFYGPRFALAFLPWTLPLVSLSPLAGTWRTSRAFRFGAVWLAVMLAVLSASQFKRADYLLPAFPGAAIALGCAAERWLSTRTNPRSARLAKWVFGALLAGGLAVWPVMWVVVEPAEETRQEKRPFAAAIRGHAPTPQTVLLFRAESHLLAYHLGPPLHTLVEWGELKDTLAEPGPHTVVMPPEFVADAERITGRRLVLVARLADYVTVSPPRPLVCLRTAE